MSRGELLADLSPHPDALGDAYGCTGATLTLAAARIINISCEEAVNTSVHISLLNLNKKLAAMAPIKPTGGSWIG